MKKLKKNIINATIDLAQFLLKNKIYFTNVFPVKVNLGCGLKCLPDWINIDGSLTSLFGSTKISLINKLLYKLAGSSKYFSFNEYNRIIKTCNLRFFNLNKKIPIQNNYVDFIYSSHFLEHLNKKDGQSFLEECYRILKKDGLLRISVPDLDYAFDLYKKNQIEDMMGLFFYTSDSWDFAAHKHGYNFDYLKTILEKIGFINIQKKSYQQGECPDINFLDIYPEHSLFIECKK